MREDAKRIHEEKIRAVDRDDRIEAAYLMGKEEATLKAYHILGGLASLEIEMEFEASMKILESMKKGIKR